MSYDYDKSKCFYHNKFGEKARKCTKPCSYQGTLSFAFLQKADKCSPRQLRYLDYIGQFSTDLRHIKGKDNVVADALSRIQAIQVPPTIDFEQIADDQDDDDLKDILSGKTSLKLQAKTLPNLNKPLYCSVDGDTIRPYVPRKHRYQIFRSVHDLSHPGQRTSSKLVRQRFVWPNIDKDCTSWAKSCQACQRSKVSRHTRTPLSSFPLDTERFTTVHIDIVGPLPSCQGFRYLITCIDRFTRWVEAIPVSDITSETVAFAFYANWISRYGVPCHIISDQGRQFESNLYHQLCKLLGARKLRTTAYHPQGNGMIERVHRQLKAAIKCHENTNWLLILPTVLLGMRAALKEDLGTSSAELVFGKTLRLPGDFLNSKPSQKPTDEFVERLKSTMENLRPPAVSHHTKDKPFMHQDLKTCSHVFLRDDSVRKPLQQPYSGPHAVLSRGDKTFTISIGQAKKVVSADRLKPAYILTSVNNEEDAGLQRSRTHRKVVRFNELPTQNGGEFCGV